MPEAAPLFEDVARAPDGGRAYWLSTADGVRIRMGVWAEGRKGTVLLFPGRTEYVEKYGPATADLQALGYAVVSIDWRGQGLADRGAPDPRMGHVGAFSEYQLDVAAVMAAVRELSLPEPLWLLAHSMGGCIGLRALMNGLPVKGAAFSAPMWGIAMTPPLRPVAWGLGWLSRAVDQPFHYAPGGGSELYVLNTPFEENTLTTDRGMFEFMQDQARAHPELLIGGAGAGWVFEALKECRALDAMPSPPVPTVTGLGLQEKIVDPDRIRSRMARWPGGTLIEMPGCEHELMMESRATQVSFFDAVEAVFTPE